MAYQTNASDREQQRLAERLQRDEAKRFRRALREVMATPSGRIVLWTLLRMAGMFKSIWDPSSRIHYNAGRQDFGHELLDIYLDTHDEAYYDMEREARVYARNAEIQARSAQAPRSGEQEDVDG